VHRYANGAVEAGAFHALGDEVGDGDDARRLACWTVATVLP
jgi:hypothetical protein